MTNQATIDKLIEMRLTTMADAFRSQTMDPSMKGIPFEDRFGLLVDVEYSSRKNNRLKRLIHNAEFDQPSASIADIEQKDIFELLHCRRKRSSTIFCSQYQRDGWYEQLGGDASPLADAILDRIVHDAYMIDIIPVDPSKDISMREIYGLKESDCM